MLQKIIKNEIKGKPFIFFCFALSLLITDLSTCAAHLMYILRKKTQNENKQEHFFLLFTINAIKHFAKYIF